MSAKGIWIAFGVGVAAGATVALLYAPQAGVGARRQLKKNIDEGVEYLEDAAARLKEQADSLGKEAENIIKRTRGQVADVVDRASTSVSSAAKSVQSLM